MMSHIRHTDAGVDQLDCGNSFGTGHFGNSVYTQARCVKQVLVCISRAGGVLGIQASALCVVIATVGISVMGWAEMAFLEVGRCIWAE
jgi:hypothetical protein